MVDSFGNTSTISLLFSNSVSGSSRRLRKGVFGPPDPHFLPQTLEHRPYCGVQQVVEECQTHRRTTEKH